ncbi:Protein of uncharacterised function (DUF3043) [Actinobaculum suis]|uniref:Protein of uncharacterized function (DUF3043) n=1 Tax=Actinobaculum suis TaxID=1657 RepID=A0A7Z8Y996_9ACTO|nr:DUF3043 domain-containing protein [Actinobaculum suis]VDG76652.1 Protein of uncharacterised function (DUF3043) [Actinobaculum suis]
MALFGKKKTEPEEKPETSAPAQRPKGYTPGKGRPTPKRKDVERRNRRPIISEKSTLTREEKKILKAEQRARSNEIYERQQKAMREGDEKNMPELHRGPIRRFARDCIDSRRHFATLVLPLLAIIFIGIFVLRANPVVMQYFVWGTYGLLFVMLFDGWLAAYRARTLVAHKYGADKVPDRTISQMWVRTFYPRRWRMPRTQCAIGEYPEGGAPEDLRAARQKNREDRRQARAEKREEKRTLRRAKKEK